jgi:hypothetical protein
LASRKIKRGNEKDGRNEEEKKKIRIEKWKIKIGKRTNKNKKAGLLHPAFY